MYSRNSVNFLLYLIKEGKMQLNQQDEISREAVVTHGGEGANARVRGFFKLAALAAKLPDE